MMVVVLRWAKTWNWLRAAGNGDPATGYGAGGIWCVWCRQHGLGAAGTVGVVIVIVWEYK